MMKKKLILLESIGFFKIFLLWFLSFSDIKNLYAQENKHPEDKNIIVGIREEPPFIIRDTDGSFYGLSVDLWNYLSHELKIKYKFKEYSHVLDIIKSLKYNEIDICINPLHVSGPRIRQMDVTQPFFVSSLGIATSNNKADNSIKIFLSNIFSWEFFKLISMFIGIVVLFGTFVWLVENSNNNKDFRHGMNGILDGIWWSTVTITTVGYGDKTPKTTLGRVISMVWMFAAISLISSFTATITSRLTVDTLDTNINYLRDLKKMGEIGTVKNSGSEDYLFNHNIKMNISFDTPLEGLSALADKQIDVFVFDKSVMHYMVEEYKLDGKIKILPITFNKQYFSFILPKKNELFDKINPEIVEKINRDSWQRVLKKYNLQDKQ